MLNSEDRWAQMPGPMRMADDICRILTDPGKGTVWLDGGISWADGFRLSVREQINWTDGKLNIEFVDAGAESRAPEELVFSYDRTAEEGYRPAKGLVAFLKEKGVLSDWIIWLYHTQSGWTSAANLPDRGRG